MPFKIKFVLHEDKIVYCDLSNEESIVLAYSLGIIIILIGTKRLTCENSK